jgi:5-methylcytosine-specific restriction endonuclease McrA
MQNTEVTPAQKKAVIERSKGYCEYCRSPARFSLGPFVVDHIIPKAHSGQAKLSNLAYACFGCNGHKHAKIRALDPLTRKLVRLFNPRRQRWKEHFTWSTDATLMVGLTATGRATIKALRLNREELINFRAAFRILKLHPPE